VIGILGNCAYAGMLLVRRPFLPASLPSLITTTWFLKKKKSVVTFIIEVEILRSRLPREPSRFPFSRPRLTRPHRVTVHPLLPQLKSLEAVSISRRRRHHFGTPKSALPPYGRPVGVNERASTRARARIFFSCSQLPTSAMRLAAARLLKVAFLGLLLQTACLPPRLQASPISSAQQQQVRVPLLVVVVTAYGGLVSLRPGHKFRCLFFSGHTRCIHARR
jgi:hypothetical protein